MIGRAIAAFVAALSLAIGTLGANSASGEAAVQPRPAKARLVAPADVTEGETFTISVRVKQPGAAKRVVLERQVEDIFGDVSWSSVDARRPKSRVRFAVTADGNETGRFRVVVVSRVGKSRSSKPVNVRYWHWTPISSVLRYDTVGQVGDSKYVDFPMSGQRWTGWYAASTAFTAGETRYTLGRNCKAFRGMAGVGDGSDDGASASITLSTVSPQNTLMTVWQSPTLIPGVLVPIDLPLPDQPYRFVIAGKNTSSPVTANGRTQTPNAVPGIGGASFLCHDPLK